MFKTVFRQELKLRLLNSGDLIALVLFFIMSFSLFPFALGPEPQLLKTVAAGIVWISVLFSIQIGLQRLFTEDFNDGTLEVIGLQSAVFETAVFAKILVFWLFSGLPLVLAVPLASLAFDIDIAGTGLMMASLFMGTICLCLVGAIGAALSLGARQVALIVPLLTLPLTIPVLIFGVSAVNAALNGFEFGRILLVLLGLTLLYLPVGIFSCSHILKQALK